MIDNAEEQLSISKCQLQTSLVKDDVT